MYTRLIAITTWCLAVLPSMAQAQTPGAPGMPVDHTAHSSPSIQVVEQPPPQVYAPAQALPPGGTMAYPGSIQMSNDAYGLVPYTEADLPNNTISLDTYALLVGEVALEYERVISPSISAHVGPTFFIADPAISFYGSRDEDPTRGLGLNAGLRLFTGARAPEGFFLGLGATAAHVNVEHSYADVDANTVGFAAAAMLGYTWLIDGSFAFSLALGLKYADFSVRVVLRDGFSEDIGFEGVVPVGRLGLGFAL